MAAVITSPSPGWLGRQVARHYVNASLSQSMPRPVSCDTVKITSSSFPAADPLAVEWDPAIATWTLDRVNEHARTIAHHALRSRRDLRPYWATNPLRESRVINALTLAKCEYCGRYGKLGQCEGCGAANKPAEMVA